MPAQMWPVLVPQIERKWAVGSTGDHAVVVADLSAQ